jgi:hypothetical protein
VLHYNDGKHLSYQTNLINPLHKDVIEKLRHFCGIFQIDDFSYITNTGVDFKNVFHPVLNFHEIIFWKLKAE